jgi:hypothetical protein
VALLGSVKAATKALVLVCLTRDPGVRGFLLLYPLLGCSDTSVRFFVETAWVIVGSTMSSKAEQKTTDSEQLALKNELKKCSASNCYWDS